MNIQWSPYEQLDKQEKLIADAVIGKLGIIPPLFYIVDDPERTERTGEVSHQVWFVKSIEDSNRPAAVKWWMVAKVHPNMGLIAWDHECTGLYRRPKEITTNGSSN